MRRPLSLSLPVAGYGIAIGMVLAVALVALRALDAADTHRLVEIRTHEYQATLAERLRWRSELQVAAGRGLVITGDPRLREKLMSASDAFDSLLRDLQQAEQNPRSLGLLADVQRAAAAYEHEQDELLELKERASADSDVIADRFERELLPLRRALAAAIDAYLTKERALLAEAYSRIEVERNQTNAWAFGSVVSVGLLAAALVWFISFALARMYRRERVALERAQIAVAARDEVLGIVSHDLRNPLGAIMMKAALMQRMSDVGKLQEQAGAVKRIAARMEHLIKSSLDVATIEAGRLSVSPARCEAEAVLHETVGLFEAAAAGKSIVLSQRVTRDGLAFRGDRERVLQVLSNLVGNALKFTPEGGTIDLTAEQDDGCVRFTVSDTGSGIPHDHLPHVFDRFWKADGVGMKGTGLGLFIARGIVQAHGGLIWVESQPGRGATFRFTLPSDGAMTGTARGSRGPDMLLTAR